MKVTDILPGTKVEIRLVQSADSMDENRPFSGVYISNVFDILDEHTMELYLPLEGGNLVALPEHIRYEVIFLPTGGIFEAEGILEERFHRDNFYLIRMNFPSVSLRRFQRREYYRLDCNIPVMYSSLEENEAKCESMEELHELMKENISAMRVRGYGTILDISGGGIRFSTKTDMSGCKDLLFQFQITSGEEILKIEVIGHVIRSTYFEDSRIFSNSIRFIFKDAKLQEKIIRYIFEEERRIRQKEQGLI